MNSPLLKYLIAFMLGALFSYLIISFYSNKLDDSSLIANNTPQASCEQNELGEIVARTLDTATKKKEHALQDTQQDIDSCKQEVSKLTEQLAFAKESEENAKKSESIALQNFVERLTEAKTEAAVLQQRLNELEPSSVDYDELKKMVVPPFNARIVGLPDNLKKSIYDFHKRDDDLDWGYLKQQQITDFIRAQVNYPYINLLSVICKVDTCELAMSEKENIDTMTANGASKEEVQDFINLREPKYKAIFDEIKINSNIDMKPELAMPGRFEVYMIMTKR